MSMDEVQLNPLLISRAMHMEVRTTHSRVPLPDLAPRAGMGSRASERVKKTH